MFLTNKIARKAFCVGVLFYSIIFCFSSNIILVAETEKSNNQTQGESEIHARLGGGKERTKTAVIASKALTGFMDKKNNKRSILLGKPVKYTCIETILSSQGTGWPIKTKKNTKYLLRNLHF